MSVLGNFDPPQVGTAGSTHPLYITRTEPTPETTTGRVTVEGLSPNEIKLYIDVLEIKRKLDYIIMQVEALQEQKARQEREAVEFAIEFEIDEERKQGH